MKTIKQVEVKPVYVHFIPDKKEMEEACIYISKEYEVAVHLCLCGCKELTVTPLGQSRGGWTLSEHNDRITLTPSIANYQVPCNSHYIITNNKANFV